PNSVPGTLNSARIGKLKSTKPSMHSATKRCALVSLMAPALRDRLLQLLEDGRVLEGGDVLGNLLALGDRAQQTAHDLAGARLRQVVAEADVFRLGDRADQIGRAH